MKNTIKQFPIAFVLFFIACKKDTRQTQSTNDNTGECMVTSGKANSDTVTGRWIVSLNNNQFGRSASRDELAKTSSSILQRYNITGQKLMVVYPGEPAGFIARLTNTEAALIANDPSIQIIEPDKVVALSTCFTVSEPKLITWNVNRTGYGDGKGKTAWIIDTGIDMDHPDLDTDAGRSKCFISGQTSVDDANGHGTHVAGIIGAKNNAIGILGVASGARLVSLRVLGAYGEGLLSNIIQAVAYVNANASAGDVVNMSLGEDGTSATLNQQVQNTAARGIYFAIAAGNDAKPANKYSPANANGTNIFTVSAIDSLDRFASFSNYGNDVVDYAAPGVRILSTYTAGRYAYLSGTSMAAPHVAGLLLLKGANLNTSGTAKNDPDGTADRIAHY